ncbi:MAG: type II secretion system protein, partial [Opitutae bacterium]|nr:type II secretion system protein [Opitutae bacterium]
MMFRRSAIGGLHRPGIRMPDWNRRGSAAGSPRLQEAGGPTRGIGGFSLLEILVVLALLGLISALLIGGSTTLLRTVTSDDVQNTALGAIAGARHGAVLTGRTLELRYDEQARVLDWGEDRAALAGEGALRLLPPVRSSSILVGGQLVESPLARVRFYPDGTCDPFRLEIVRDQANLVLTIDPWTCTV